MDSPRDIIITVRANVVAPGYVRVGLINDFLATLNAPRMRKALQGGYGSLDDAFLARLWPELVALREAIEAAE